jgi:predicted RNA-binding Zn-ribbon protein involved in translation (DUF1610 family)
VSESSNAWEVIYERGASIACPFCGWEEWKPLGALQNLSIVLAATTRDGTMVRGPGETGGLGAYAYACANCGFVRLHSKLVVDNPVP